MRAVIQRVKSCSVDIAGQTVGSIGAGMLILLGVEAADTKEDALKMIEYGTDYMPSNVKTTID